VVYSLRDGLEIMRGLEVPIVQIRATGGGARSALWRQMQADIYNAEVVTLSAEEGPAYGAALLAGVGTGLFASVADAVDQCVSIAGRTPPDPTTQPRYEKAYVIYRELYGMLRPSMHQLAGL